MKNLIFCLIFVDPPLKLRSNTTKHRQIVFFYSKMFFGKRKKEKKIVEVEEVLFPLWTPLDRLGHWGARCLKMPQNSRKNADFVNMAASYKKISSNLNREYKITYFYFFLILIKAVLGWFCIFAHFRTSLFLNPFMDFFD